MGDGWRGAVEPLDAVEPADDGDTDAEPPSNGDADGEPADDGDTDGEPADNGDTDGEPADDEDTDGEPADNGDTASAWDAASGAKLRQHSTRQRSTRQRRAVFAALAEHPDFTSAQDLHRRLRAQGELIGLTTVYRTLRALTEAGLVDAVRGAAGRQHFRVRSTAEHQHYLRCRECGFNVPVTSRAVERWTEATAERLGFTQVEHVVELVGLCARCQTSDNDVWPDN